MDGYFTKAHKSSESPGIWHGHAVVIATVLPVATQARRPLLHQEITNHVPLLHGAGVGTEYAPHCTSTMMQTIKTMPQHLALGPTTTSTTNCSPTLAGVVLLDPTGSQKLQPLPEGQKHSFQSGLKWLKPLGPPFKNSVFERRARSHLNSWQLVHQALELVCG